MKKNYNFNLNKFLQTIKLKKQYLKNLKQKNLLLEKHKEKNYKAISYSFTPFKNYLSIANKFTINDFLVTDIIDISFSRSNTFVHVMDFLGNLKFFYSAGSFQHKGKTKKSRFLVFKDFYKTLLIKLKFLKGKPLALHLKNVGSKKFWIIKKLKKKFFIKCVRSFNLNPYNGCRKRKVRRKKFKKTKKWSSGLRRQIVNLLSFLIAGSNPAFFIVASFSKYNAGWQRACFGSRKACVQITLFRLFF